MNRLEIWLVNPVSGIDPLLDVPIYGRISSMHLFRAKSDSTDRLFLITDRHEFCVLGYDNINSEIKTYAQGSLKHRVGRLSDEGILTCVDPKSRVIAIHQYDGSLQLIAIDSRGDLAPEAFDVRLDELCVRNICFLSNTPKPTLCVLYQDNKELRHIKTYIVDVREKEIKIGPYHAKNVENGASYIIPVTGEIGGVLCIGEEIISYHKDKIFKAAKMKPTQITAVTQVDHTRYLMGDLTGNLYVIVLKHDDSFNVAAINIEPLGVTSSASALSYLDGGLVYVGSTYGDSQLIKLNPEKDANGSYLELIANYPNLGAIVDFEVLDLDRSGQAQLVTCSGGFKDGSIRVVRNGIGITEEASSELPGVRGLWSLRDPASSGSFDKYLVQSFVGESRVLAMEGEELGEDDSASFERAAQTLYAGNTADGTLVQVTTVSALLLDGSTTDRLSEWKPSDENAAITVAHGNGSQLLIAVGRQLLLLSTADRELKVVNEATLDHEVSCLDITPLDRSATTTELAAVGVWGDMTVRILSVPALNELHRDGVGADILPRSVLFAQVDVSVSHLFAGLGDGNLLTWELDPKAGRLFNSKKLALGTQPINLTPFTNKDKTHVFAACDRPTVVSASNGKLIFSNVNAKDVNVMTPFRSSSFGDCLAFATESMLIIGHMDDIQKLHIRTINLGEQPRRIAHHPSLNAFAVATIRFDTDDKSSASASGETKFLRIFDQQTFELLDSFQMEDNEDPAVVAVHELSEDGLQYILVGTGYVLPEEDEPTCGRILIFKLTSERKLLLVSQKQVKGSVYALSTIGYKIVAGINSKVAVFRAIFTNNDTIKLEHECGHHGSIVIVGLRTMGEYILVGDLMQSLSLLRYKSDVGAIEEVARDYDSAWVMAIDILNHDLYIASDNSHNIYTLQRNLESNTEEDKARLEHVGKFHVGDQINRFRKGCLVMNSVDDNPNKIVGTHIWGAISGAIGVIAPLSRVDFQFFSRLETCLQNVIQGVGGFKHKAWRCFHSDRKSEASRNFVDGDLIESLLDLKLPLQQKVAEQMEITHTDLLRRVEEIARIH